MLLALVLLAQPPADPAKTAFDRMEKKVFEARTLSLRYTVDLGGGPDKSVGGRVLLAPGGKFRLELESPEDKIRTAMVSDGKRVWVSHNGGQGRGSVTYQPEVIRGSITRYSPLICSYLLSGGGEVTREWAARDALFPVSGFRLGKKEAVGKREAQAVEFEMAGKWAGGSIPVTVWIDTASGLPVRHASIRAQTDGRVTHTTTYTAFEVDGKVDEAEFIIPK